MVQRLTGHGGRFNNRYRTRVSTIMGNSTYTCPFAGAVFEYATVGTHDYRHVHALVRGTALEVVWCQVRLPLT